jgi:hypothetical protein
VRRLSAPGGGIFGTYALSGRSGETDYDRENQW